MKQFVIFRCDKDDCWVVAAVDPDGDIARGVAECPNVETARKVLDAMRIREASKWPKYNTSVDVSCPSVWYLDG